jgi:integrase
MAEVTTQRIDALLSAKAAAGMAHATRLDIRNILCGIFTQAMKWGYWKDANPALLADAGKARAVREQKKLTDDETMRLLAALPADVSVIVQVSLFCTLRISEVLGLQWKHIDFERNVLMVRQRWYRGNLDEVKTDRSRRDVSMGYLGQALMKRYPGNGHDDDFVFSVQTHVGDWNNPGECRDDRDIHQHFLRPAAEALGIYRPGFGFHAFRREAITNMAEAIGLSQAQRMAGHAKADMTMHYTLQDHKSQDEAVRKFQERLLGESAGGVQ